MDKEVNKQKQVEPSLHEEGQKGKGSQMIQNNQKTHLNPFSVSNGIALFSFAIVALTLSVDIWIPILFLAASIVVGIFILFPSLSRKIKWLHPLLSSAVLIAWYFGFIFGWLRGATNVPDFWKNPIFVIGFIWLLVIILVLQSFGYQLSNNKRSPFVRWMLRLSFPIALLVASLYYFIQTVYLSGGILLGMVLLTTLVSLGIWEIDPRIPGLSN
jgi:hypothetical protein